VPHQADQGQSAILARDTLAVLRGMPGDVTGLMDLFFLIYSL